MHRDLDLDSESVFGFADSIGMDEEVEVSSERFFGAGSGESARVWRSDGDGDGDGDSGFEDGLGMTFIDVNADVGTELGTESEGTRNEYEYACRNGGMTSERWITEMDVEIKNLAGKEEREEKREEESKIYRKDVRRNAGVWVV